MSVFIADNTRDHLVRQAEDGHPLWIRVRDYATRSASSATLSINAVPNLALAWHITKNPLYRDACKYQLLRHCVPENTLTRDSYYDYRTYIPNISLGLDLLRSELNAGEIQQIAGWLMDRADAVWPETNPARANGWAVSDPSNNYFYGFLTTWMAARVCLKDDPRAQGHFDLGLTKYHVDVVPWMRSWGLGGVFAESTNYDSTGSLARTLLAVMIPGAMSLSEETEEWFADTIRWRIASTCPDFQHVYPLGDQPRVSSAPLSPYDTYRMLAAMAMLPSGHPVLPQARWWLTRIPLTTWENQVAWEFMITPETRLATLEEPPLHFQAPGAGLCVGRSSWAPDALYWGFWSGPLRAGHQNKDANGFLVWKNGWLIGNASIWSLSGSLSQTDCHNNLTLEIGGKVYGQENQIPTEKWPGEAGELKIAHVGRRCYWYRGEAANAYVTDRSHGGRRLLSKYQRDVVVVPEFQDVRIISEAEPAIGLPVFCQWNYHTPFALPSGDDTTLSNSGREMATLSTIGADVVTPLKYSRDGSTTSYRIQTSGNQEYTHFAPDPDASPCRVFKLPLETAQLEVPMAASESEQLYIAIGMKPNADVLVALIRRHRDPVAKKWVVDERRTYRDNTGPGILEIDVPPGQWRIVVKERKP